MLKKIKNSTIIFFLCAFLVACQPTPEKAAVIGKGDNEMNDKIYHTASPGRTYDAPVNWKETLDGLSDKLKIELDAKIEVPDACNLPVVQIEPIEITQEVADRLIDGLIGSAPFIAQRTGYTKSEILENIAAIQKDISDPNSDFNQVLEKGTEEYEQALAELQAELKAWKEALKTAPDEIEPKEASRTFEKISEEGIEDYWLIEGYPKLENTKSAYLKIVKPASAPFYLESVTFFKNQPFTIFSANTEKLNGVTISIDEAKSVAEDFLEKLGMKDMQVSLACSTYQKAFAKKTVFDAPQCYVFFFTRNVEGVPIVFQESRLDAEAIAKQYAPLWGQESIRVCVDDSGIVGFNWGCPFTVTKVLNTNVEILPFNDIKEIFKKDIAMKCDVIYETDPGIIQRKIHINRIVLGLTKVMKKDSPGQFLLIPTWSFFCYEVDKYNGHQPGGYKLDENNEHIQDAIGRSFLTINAIDGSVIDPTLGY